MGLLWFSLHTYPWLLFYAMCVTHMWDSSCTDMPLCHVSCIYKSVCLFTSRVALSTWPEAWESHERMGSPGQAFLISCGESPKPGKQTFAHFFTISTWGRRQLTWGKRQLPSPCWDCINFFLPAYCEKQPGIRYWYSSIQSKLKCRGVGVT